MKTKRFVIAAILLFWAFVTAVFLAGLTNIGKSGENAITGNVVAASDSALTQELVLTKGEVEKHNSSSSCWMIIENKVYDVTSYLGEHPAGEASILSGCGKDSTQIYSTPGHSDYAKSLLFKYFIGNLGEKPNNIPNQTETTAQNTTPPANTTVQNIANKTKTAAQNTTVQTITTTTAQASITLSPQEISKHGASSSCWAYVYRKVYDLTSYIPIHSGGRSQILSICGKNGTSLFESGPHSPSDLAFLNPYFIGNLNGLRSIVQDTQTETTAQNTTTQTNTNNSTIPSSNTTTPSNQTNPSNITNQTNTNNSTIPSSNTTTPSNQTNPSNITNQTNTTISQIHSITVQEISRHSYSYNCWSYVNTKVYDFTSYISRYPGGPGLILNICGKNGTSLFESDPHAPSDLSSINIYFIGNLATTNLTTISKDGTTEVGEEEAD